MSVPGFLDDGGDQDVLRERSTLTDRVDLDKAFRDLLEEAEAFLELADEGEAGAVDTARSASGVVVSPSGDQMALGDGGSPTVELAEQGFYSVRMQGADGRPFTVAVNIDPGESDLTPLPPEQFVANATGQAAVTMAGESLERPDLTPAEVERRQGIWWYLLVLAVGALLVEAWLSNRLSTRTRPLGAEAGSEA